MTTTTETTPAGQAGHPPTEAVTERAEAFLAVLADLDGTKPNAATAAVLLNHARQHIDRLLEHIERQERMERQLDGLLTSMRDDLNRYGYPAGMRAHHDEWAAGRLTHEGENDPGICPCCDQPSAGGALCVSCKGWCDQVQDRIAAEFGDVLAARAGADMALTGQPVIRPGIGPDGPVGRVIQVLGGGLATVAWGPEMDRPDPVVMLEKTADLVTFGQAPVPASLAMVRSLRTWSCGRCAGNFAGIVPSDRLCGGCVLQILDGQPIAMCLCTTAHCIEMECPDPACKDSNCPERCICRPDTCLGPPTGFVPGPLTPPFCRACGPIGECWLTTQPAPAAQETAAR